MHWLSFDVRCESGGYTHVKYYKVQKEVKSTQKQPSCEKNGAALKSLDEKSCKIKDGGQKMVAMMLMLINCHY